VDLEAAGMAGQDDEPLRGGPGDRREATGLAETAVERVPPADPSVDQRRPEGGALPVEQIPRCTRGQDLRRFRGGADGEDGPGVAGPGQRGPAVGQDRKSGGEGKGAELGALTIGEAETTRKRR